MTVRVAPCQDRAGRNATVSRTAYPEPARGARREGRAIIGVRTKAALAAAKVRGVTLGNPRLSEVRPAAHKAAAVANEAAADRYAATVLPIIKQIKRAGAQTLRDIANALNERGVQTARGGQWCAMTVRNVLARA